MVAIITGKGTGLERSSAFVLGSQGQLGSSLQGRGGDGVYVNASSGNLLVTRQDEFLLGLGPDAAISRTYNSLATVGDGDNNDQWQASVYRRVTGLSGTYGASGTTVKRIDWDGSETVYSWVSDYLGTGNGAYVGRDGDGAYDTLVYSTGSSQWTWQDGDSRIKDIYNSSGKLLSTADLDGNSLTYTWTGSLITRITTQNGEYTNLTYNGSNQLTELVTYYDSTHQTRVFYEYDGSGRLSVVKVNLDPSDNSKTTGSNYSTTYTYDGASNRVASITQDDGSSLTIGYTLVSSDYRVTSLTQLVAGSATRVTTLAYDTSARTTTITDNAGNVYRMRYDASDQLTSITYPPSAVGAPAQIMSFAYNSNGDVTSRTDALGRVTNYTYDNNGNMLSSQDAAGNRIERTYGSNNELVTETSFLVADPDGSGSGTAGAPIVTRYIYSDTDPWTGVKENHLRFVVTAEGKVTEYIYDSGGDGPGLLTSTIAYTANTYAGGTFTESALASWASGLSDRSTVQRVDTHYDGRGAIDWVKRYGTANSSGAGLTAEQSIDTYVYDQAGQLLSRNNSASTATEHFAYDGLGRVTSSTDLAGNSTTITFNDASTTTTILLANGLSRISVYNKAGELLTYTESGADLAEDAVTTNKYDNLGRLRMVTTKLTSSTSLTVYMLYDNAGRKVADIGPDGAVTEYRYDAANNITSTTRYLNKLSSGQLASLVASGEPANVALSSIRPSANAGDMWTFSIYDDANRLVEAIDGAGAVSVLTYDGASQLVSTKRYANTLSSSVIADLKAEAITPNLWLNPNNGTLWASGNLSITATGTQIDGSDAYKFTTITAGVWEGFLGGNVTSVVAGDTISLTISLMAVGSVTNSVVGIYGLSTYWGSGAGTPTTASISSGPGALAQAWGSGWSISGLSTTEATRFTITRKIESAEDAEAVVYVMDWDFHFAAGDALIAAAPVFTRTRGTAAYLPTADAAKDQLSRNFYDNDGRLVATLDGAGGLTQIFYDQAGRKVREIGYAKAASSSYWASGTLSDLITSVGTSSADRRVDYVYDGRGFLRYTLDAAAHPTEYVYDARGNVVRTIDYAGSIASASSYSVASVQSGLSTASLTSHASNRISRITYDDAGRAAFTIDAEGGVVGLTYDNAGRVVKQIAYATAYTISGDQNLSTMTSWAATHASDADNRLTRSIYDKAGHLAYTVDGESYVTRFDHDAAGRVTRQRIYDAQIAVTDSTTKANLDSTTNAITGSAWAETSYTYNAAGLVYEQTDAVGAVTRFAYDAFGQVTDTTLAYGTSDATTTHRAYDTAGRVVSETAAYGTGIASTVSYAYDGAGNLVTRTDALGHAATYTYDNMGRVLTARVPVNATSGDDLVTTYEYNAFGAQVKVTDARGYATFSYYNALGQLALQVDAELYATATAYNPFGEVYTVTRYAARTTGTPTVTTPSTIVTGSLDATTTFLYDKRGHLARMTDAEGHYEIYVDNIFGQREATWNKAGGLLADSYDRRGLAWGTFIYKDSYRPDGTQEASYFFQRLFVRDSRGNAIQQYESYALSEQRITNYEYDKANRLTKVTHEALTVTASDMSGTSTATPYETYTYNLRGQLIQSVDAAGGKSTTWYDALGRKTHQVDALGGLTQWTYDANGNAQTMRAWDTAVSIPGTPPSSTPPTGTAAYREVAYTYDWANRLTVTTVSHLDFGRLEGANYATSSDDTSTSERVYDKGGNVIKVIDGNGNIDWAWYDGLGRKVAGVDRENYLTYFELDTNGNAKKEIRYATQITGSFSVGTTIGTGTSVAGMQTLAGTNAADRETNFTYDRNGKRLTESRSGVSASTVSSGGALSTATAAATITYTYNALGMVATRTEANGEVTTYGYDNWGRLTSVTGPAYLDQGGTSVQRLTETFYDAFDRVVRTEVNKVGGSSGDDRVTTFTYLKDRLDQTTDAMGFIRYYGYDAAGRVVQEKWTRTKSDGSTEVTEATNYRYDAAGRMITQANATWSGSAWDYGEATWLRYNAHGEVTGKGISASPSAGAVYQETFEYDAGGRMWRTNSGDGVTKVMLFDKAGNVTLTLSSTGANLASTDVSTLVGSLSGTGAAAGTTSITDAVTTISVFDKRGQQTESREPGRQLSYNGSSFATANLKNTRTYNAFGEVLSETDARGYAAGATAADFTTNYSYNAMGRLIEKKSPTVSTTSESGSTTTARPTETYYYDISGRLVGVRDANNNLTTRALLAGTGMSQGEEALVTAEFHADGGIARTFYDVFGDMRIQRNELYVTGSTTDYDEVYAYDKMGRVTSVQHRGNLLTDTYAYDQLGRRTRHYNSQLTSSVVERTDYDLMGRVSAQIDMMGGTTSYSYSWSGSIGTTGLGTFGGWTKTTTNMASLASTEDLDYFGRTVARTDYGAHSYSYTFDLAGRLVTQTGASSQSQAYSWLNTGRLYQLVDTAGSGKNVITAKYAYDENGNRTYEGYAGTVYSFKFPSSTTSATETLQNATIAYDALNRITTFTDKDSGGTTRITVTTSYDLAGNIRRVQSTYPDLAHPSFGAVSTDRWFRYDNMNRMVIADGALSGSTIVHGAYGYEVTYDLAGRRATQTKDAALTGISTMWVSDGGIGSPIGDFDHGHYEDVTASYTGERREEYSYNADGSLATVKFAETGYDDNGDGTVTGNGVIGTGVLRAQYTRDGLQRITDYQEFEANGVTVSHHRYDISYDARGNVLADTVVQKKVETGINTYVTYTTNSYTSDGRLSSSVADQWKNGSDSAVPDTSMSYSYVWYDGARIDTTTYDKDTGSGLNPLWTSTYNYDSLGRVASVNIDDDRDRTVSFAYAPEGQILNRREHSAATANPEDQRYFVNGQQIGEITSDGNNDPSLSDYAQNVNNIRNWTPQPQLAPFRWNTSSGVTRGTFGPSAGYEVINPYSQGAQSTSSNYTVRDGETVQSIAQAVWGDASLWYMIAEANGLSAGSQLVAGQSLVIPDRVTNAHNSSKTFRVYDPNSALGDLSPTSAKPPKKPGACAMIGQILMVAIAIGVTILTSGAAVAAMGGAPGIFSGVAALATGTIGGVAGAGAIGVGTLMAAGAIGGAVGSIASQAFGVATGLQNKFSWKGVAMSAISGAVSAGLPKVGGIFAKSGFVGGAARGLTSSAISQGIGVATGLQKNFDWVGVAGAGLGGGISAEMGAGSWEDLSLRNISTNIGASLISGLANAGLRSLATGTSFGDNLLAALPDVIGGTIGSLIGQRAARSDRLQFAAADQPAIPGQPAIASDASPAPQQVPLNPADYPNLTPQEVSAMQASHLDASRASAINQIVGQQSSSHQASQSASLSGSLRNGVLRLIANGNDAAFDAYKNLPARIRNAFIDTDLEVIAVRGQIASAVAHHLSQDGTTLTGLHLDSRQYHFAVNLGVWRNVIGSNTAGNAVTSNSQVQQAANTVNSLPASTTGDIEASPELRRFVYGIANETEEAQMSNGHSWEKVVRVERDGQDFVVTAIRGGGTQGSRILDLINGNTATILHTHWAGGGLDQVPKGADHSLVHLRGRPAFMYQGDTNRLYEVFRNGTTYKVGRVTPTGQLSGIFNFSS